MDISKIAEKWARRWEDAKEDIVDALRDANVQNKWKSNVLSKRAIKLRRERLKEAIDNGLIEAGLAEVDPADWAKQVTEGIENKKITDVEKKKFEERVKPYLEIIEEGKKRLEDLGYTGKQALVWWYENVSEKLKEKKEQLAKERLKQTGLEKIIKEIS